MKHTSVSSAKAAFGATTAGAAGSGVTLLTLTGGSASASAITYALGAVGSIIGGGMAAGLGVLIGGPVLLGTAVYGITTCLKK